MRLNPLATELGTLSLGGGTKRISKQILATRTLRNAGIVACIAPGSAIVARASYAPTTIKTTGRQLTVAVDYAVALRQSGRVVLGLSR